MPWKETLPYLSSGFLGAPLPFRRRLRVPRKLEILSRTESGPCPARYFLAVVEKEEPLRYPQSSQNCRASAARASPGMLPPEIQLGFMPGKPIQELKDLPQVLRRVRQSWREAAQAGAAGVRGHRNSHVRLRAKRTAQAAPPLHRVSHQDRLGGYPARGGDAEIVEEQSVPVPHAFATATYSSMSSGWRCRMISRKRSNSLLIAVPTSPIKCRNARSGLSLSSACMLQPTRRTSSVSSPDAYS